ncbi:hypothetical protein [Bradyrhizobium sp. OK095]|uniref:hypothetical protein n=1 Tax=Bradyrhizobium sp. OK095 TaxID=1882760 RepID=UPI0008B7B691|nr:hypothetical protein [Bradyrhizobium sp. OK095]SEN66946.1 hypothetical protein SAMN05443254_11027 [Bradyrhizobium sp. OK095]
MPSSLIDVCRFNPTAGGATDWTYSSAVTGYQSPAAAGAVNGAQYSYRAESADLSQWEVGTGVYNSGAGVLTRAAVLFNSAGTTAKISFSAVPQVAVVALAEDLVRGQTGHIPGEPGTGSAASGEIGETSKVAFSLSFSGSASPKNLTSIIVPAGDLELMAHVQVESGGAITSSDWSSIISTNSTPSISNANSIDGLNHHTRMPSGLDYSVMHVHVPYPVSNAIPTTYYLHGQVTYSGGTPSASGYIRYRRPR